MSRHAVAVGVPAGDATGGSRPWGAAAGILAAACGLALALAFSGVPVSALVNSWFPSDSPEVQSALFSAYYFVLGVLTTVWWPRRFGWQLGTVLQEWRLLLGLAGLLTALGLGFVLLSGPIPFHNFPWSQFTLVPFTEEALFRGLFYTGILALLRRAGWGPRATALTVAISAVAFGLAHSANYLYYPAGFVTFQIVEATLLGALLGWTRARTGSIYPAIGLHALLNFVTNVF